MIFDSLYGLFSKDMGIDLGTANTLVCVQGEGIVLCEPSVVAVKRGTNTPLISDGEPAVGNVAKDMIGKTPGNIIAIRPLKDGVIADFDITEAMIKYFIQKVHSRLWGNRPRVVISVPSGITDVEKRAVVESARRAGARRVFLIEEPLAAALGVGLPVIEPTGSMIVDVGGGTTEVAVISLGNLVTTQSIRVAGDDMDDAIVAHMKRNYNLLIGEQTSERTKIEIGSAYDMEKETSMEVKGRDLVTGLPRKTIVGSDEIREALREPIQSICEAILIGLELTPPELAADLVDSGITLAGGGVLLRGIDKVIAKHTGLPVKVADDPITAVARGTGIFLDNLSHFQGVLESADDET